MSYLLQAAFPIAAAPISDTSSEPNQGISAEVVATWLKSLSNLLIPVDSES